MVSVSSHTQGVNKVPSPSTHLTFEQISINNSAAGRVNKIRGGVFRTSVYIKSRGLGELKKLRYI